jgi:hypothetical protein
MTEQRTPTGAIRARLRRGTRYALMTALGAVVATSVATLSAHGGDAAKVHSCYVTVPNPGNNPPLGTVRIAGATEACKQNETARDWNAQGVPGPQGATGAAGAIGAAGVAGPAGASGLAGLELVRTVTQVAANSSGPGAPQSCPAGKRLISGSATINGFPLSTQANANATEAGDVFVHSWILNENSYGFVYKNGVLNTNYVHIQMLCV